MGGGAVEEVPCPLAAGERVGSKEVERVEAVAGEQVRGDGGLIRVVALELGRGGKKLRNPLRI